MANEISRMMQKYLRVQVDDTIAKQAVNAGEQ